VIGQIPHNIIIIRNCFQLLTQFSKQIYFYATNFIILLNCAFFVVVGILIEAEI